MGTPRRLVFGEVADLYDRHRPGYPPALIDDIVEEAGLAPGDRVLEVGAGTGKATAALLERDLAVVAVEPSREMAEALRRRPGADRVQVILSDFEHAELSGERFGLLVSAQAWHWVDPAAGYPRTHSALRPGGELTDTVASHGGRFTMPMRTRLCTARAVARGYSSSAWSAERYASE